MNTEPVMTTAAIAEHMRTDASALIEATTSEMAATMYAPSSNNTVAPMLQNAVTATTTCAFTAVSESSLINNYCLDSTPIWSTHYGSTPASHAPLWSSVEPNAFGANQSMHTHSAASSNPYGLAHKAPGSDLYHSTAFYDYSGYSRANPSAVVSPPNILSTGSRFFSPACTSVHKTTCAPQNMASSVIDSHARAHSAMGTNVAYGFHAQPNNNFLHSSHSTSGVHFSTRPPITSSFVNANTAYNHGFGGIAPSFTQSTTAECALTSSQVAARHVLSKDLPAFTGNPEEWPLFITNYEQSTERCGFSNQENLIRLQKSLKGQALEAVRGRLMVAIMVPHAIETLRMLYGRPDVIHQSLQRRLRKEPPVKSDKLETLIRFALAVQNYRTTMESIGLVDYLNDPMLLNDLLAKLPSDLKLDWGRRRITCGRFDIGVFDDWLFSLAACANEVTPFGLVHSTAHEENKVTRKLPRDRIMVHELVDDDGKVPSNTVSCPRCSKIRCLSDCGDFRAMKIQDRWKFVRDNKLCLRCFKNHFVRRCQSKQKCGVDGCAMVHSPLLHSTYNNKRVPESAITGSPNSLQPGTSTVLFHAKEQQKALFRYVPVTLYGKTKTLKTFALIDEGASCTLIEKDVATDLELDGPVEELCLRWTGDITQTETQSKVVACDISSQEANSPKFHLRNVRTVACLDLPEQSLEECVINKMNHLRDLPIRSYCATKARILIGLDHAKIGVPLEIRESKSDSLIATRCRIGWSVYGREKVICSRLQQVTHICSCNASKRLDEMMKEYFTLDSIGVCATTNPLRSKADERALEIMEATAKYDSKEKRWEAGLLWKFDQIELPDSLPMAHRRLHCLEAKMAREPELKKFLVDKIKEYEQKGYVKRLLRNETLSGGKSWYIPIFTVTNMNKNKTRIVWDAAAKANGIALNSVLLKRPDLLKSLVGVLIRFREKPVAICGDIREMFHQIKVNQKDLPAQRFLWREGDVTREPSVYVMTVMTFGASCSPSLANYVKNKNANRFLQVHPDAVNAIVENTFVDDWLQSVETEEEMIQLATRVRDIHADGGFEMRNWLSNSKRVLHHLTGSANQKQKCLTEPDTIHEKVLGMWWIPTTDEFTFVTKFDSSIFDESTNPTKRQILRIVMTVFDPLGLLGFFVIYAKIILQDVWRSGIAWDENLREQELEKWWTWVRRLRSINEVRVARCYFSLNHIRSTQLHIFVDASENAYAAVAYLRVNENGNICCSLVSSKTRVAPLKPVSIPRLELMAAILGLRLAKFVETELTLKIKRRIFWTDSKNVLYWIRSDARKYHQFVALRLGEILEGSQVNEWRWVPTALNVADDATKWSKNLDFTATSRWFAGPKFLILPETEWPETKLIGSTDSAPETIHHMELRTEAMTSLTAISPDPDRFSKWEKLRNTERYVLTFLRNVIRLPPQRLCTGSLLITRSIEDVEHIIMRNCQEEMFYAEIRSLRMQNGSLRRDSVIFKMSPYLDDFGLLRVKGRIDACDVADSIKRPIILPRNHTVTKLIVDFYHRRFHHHHNEIVVNELRQRFCIQGLRMLVKNVAKLCQVCRNRRAVPCPPEMGQLPQERLATFTRPFTFTGVDYFGPIDVVVGRRREKRWGVLFTCLTVRAVHIEITHSLSTDSFLMVFKQFICRRGVPKRILSDNGTNFRGASRILVNEIEKVSGNALEQKYPEIEWSFIPPAAPHMGGAWERMVRSVKSVLFDVLPGNVLREDTLRSVMADVENIINSRPLTYVPLESEESEAITPNHFILGSSNGIRSGTSEDDSGWALSRNFRISSQIADTFWKRWVREYLPTLTRRTKWFQPPLNPIAMNDIVVIVDETSKRNSWKRGVVIDLHHGRDGQARSAVVKTLNGLFTRPVVKLAKLDVRR